MLSLKRQLQATGETSVPTLSSFSISSPQPLSSYSLYGTTTTSSTSFLSTYPSSLSYYGNSSYPGSYTYSSQPSYGGLLLGKSELTKSHTSSSYGFTMTTASGTGDYQTSVTTTTSSLLTGLSSKVVAMDTVKKSENQVTMDTNRIEQLGIKTTEATIVLPELVDDVKLSSQAQPTSRG